jgi:hypothetical protein
MRDSIIIAKMKMIEAGIVPAMTGNQLTEMIKSLSSEEKATAKRKFRKIWRRMAKKDNYLAEFLGLGALEPTKNQLRHRSCVVALSFVKDNESEEIVSSQFSGVV